MSIISRRVCLVAKANKMQPQFACKDYVIDNPPNHSIDTNLVKIKLGLKLSNRLKLLGI